MLIKIYQDRKESLLQRIVSKLNLFLFLKKGLISKDIEVDSLYFGASPHYYKIVGYDKIISVCCFPGNYRVSYDGTYLTERFLVPISKKEFDKQFEKAINEIQLVNSKIVDKT